MPSNTQSYVSNTLDEGEILYNEAITIVKGRKKFFYWSLVNWLNNMTHDVSKRMVSPIWTYLRRINVHMGNDHALEIVGIGSIKEMMDDGVISTIPKVWQVKGLKKNLLSMG